MGRNLHQGRLALLAVAAVLSGCGGSDSAPLTQPGNDAGPVVSKYDMANRCFVIKAGGAYVSRDGSGFAATGTDSAAAERFYMKPANLGRYLFYTSDSQLLTGDGTAVAAGTARVDGADWTFAGDNGSFTATTLGKALALDGANHLAQGATPVTLAFEPSTGCSVYPEMPVGIDAPTWGNRQGTPVIGFAEVHSHMGMGSEMSDGSKHIGPSAGGVMYGHAVDRFGVVEALNNCEAMHGPDGTLSPENVVLDQNPTEHHDTVGWPTFIDWPKGDSELHQQMYYKWVERAYKAGLRTMTIHGTNIEALCDVAKQTGGDKDPDLGDVDCIDMSVGEKQVDYVKDIQDYVDAQAGGPGKGWFRIVRDPAEARAVIADGKLAVIPGLEFSNLFHCNVTFNPDGSENDACTRADIDAGVDEAWNRGVRQIFPFHDVDSALGGTGIFSSALNLVGFYGTHGFWKTYPCADGGEGDKWFYSAGTVMESAPLTRANDPITQALIDATGGLFPLYGPGRQCNARDVTGLGKYAIDKILKKGFVLDIDHAEVTIKQYMLDQGARTTPAYPMISAHGGHGGISNAQVEQIVRQGGIVYPALPNGKDYVSFLNQLKPLWNHAAPSRPLALGYGADSNGLRNLPGPRGAGSTPIVYPFTLFQGPGWGPQYAAAGIAPLKVDMLSIPNGKSWDLNVEGMSHYGLVPDIVEEIRIEGGEEATSALYRSAEAYLELWEQTQQAAAAARALPSP